MKSLFKSKKVLMTLVAMVLILASFCCVSFFVNSKKNKGVSAETAYYLNSNADHLCYIREGSSIRYFDYHVHQMVPMTDGYYYPVAIEPCILGSSSSADDIASYFNRVYLNPIYPFAEDKFNIVINHGTGYSAFVSFLNNYTGHNYLRDANVYLVNDITTQAGIADRFDGCFDGLGHSITFDNDIVEAADSSEYYCGRMFERLDGTIESLKVKNVNMTSTAGDGGKANFGGLVGRCYGTINGCIVENCKFISKRTGANKLEVAPIAGRIEDGGSVTNCMVTGGYTLSAGKDGWGTTYKIYGNYFSCSRDATNSIFNATVSGEGSGSITKPSSQDSGGLTGNWGSCSSAYSASATASSPWFRYKSGYGFNGDSTYSVYLSAFVTYETVYFSAGANGKVNSTSFSVPKGCAAVSYNNSNGTATVYNNTVTATGNAGYKFSSWSGNTATFTGNTYYVKYNANGGSGTMTNSTHVYGVSSKLSGYMFYRTGYTFAGWGTTSTGSVKYANRESVSNLTTTNEGVVNLYAIWEENPAYLHGRWQYIVYNQLDYDAIWDGDGDYIVRIKSIQFLKGSSVPSGYSSSKCFNIGGTTRDLADSTDTDIYYENEIPFETGYQSITVTTGVRAYYRKEKINNKYYYHLALISPTGKEIYAPTNCSGLFKEKYDFAGDGSSIKTDDYLDFSGLTSITFDNFNTTGVTNMSQMFEQRRKLTDLNLSGFNTSSVTDMSSMFNYCNNLTEVNMTGWNVGLVNDMSAMFKDCHELTKVTGINVFKPTSLEYAGSEMVDDYGNLTTYGMFENCYCLESLDLSGWEVSSLWSTTAMFKSCSSLKSLDVESWNLSQAEYLNEMFYGCSELTYLDLSGWNVSTSTRYMNYMFADCCSLSYLNVDGWNVSNVVNMEYLFYCCESLTELNLSSWETSSAIYMADIFAGCESIKNFNLSNFDISHVKDFTSLSLSDSHNSFDKIWLPKKFGSNKVLFHSGSDMVLSGGHRLVALSGDSNTFDDDYEGYVLVRAVYLEAETTGVFESYRDWTKAGNNIAFTYVGYDESITLPTITKTGYSAPCWVDGSGVYIGPAGQTFTPGANLNLYDRWVANTYYIVYDENGATCSSPLSDPTNQYQYEYTYDQVGQISDHVPVLKYTINYDANGGSVSTTQNAAEAQFWYWYSDTYSVGGKYGSTESVGNSLKYYDDEIGVGYYIYNLTSENNGIITFTAQWDMGNFYVTFPTPTRAGYTFNGWYTSSSGGTNLGGAGAKYAPSANVTLYAQWTPIDYTLTYYAGGGTISANATYYAGSGTYANKVLTYGASNSAQVAPSSSDISRTGYTFGGFYVGTDFRTYKDSYLNTEHRLLRLRTGANELSNHFSQGMLIAFDVTIHGAQIDWLEINDVKISDTARYQIAGDRIFGVLTYTSSDIGADARYSFLDIVVKATGNYSYTIHEFWTLPLTTQLTDTSGKLKANVSGYTGESSAWARTSNSIMAAKWTANTYTVTYNGNGNTGGSTANSTHTYDTAKALTANGFTKTGYTFAGWATSSTGSVVYSNGQSVTNLASTQGATVTLYAKWTANTYTVTYNGNGNTGGSTANSSHAYDTAKALTSNGFTKTGYTFAGWATSSTGSVVYSNGQSVTNLASTQGATVTLYAKWTANSYKIVLDNSLATTAGITNVTATYDSALPSIATAPSRTGYTFGGYYYVGGSIKSVSSTGFLDAAQKTCRVSFAIGTYSAADGKNDIIVSFKSASQIAAVEFNDWEFGSTNLSANSYFRQYKYGDDYYVIAYAENVTDRYPNQYCFIDIISTTQAQPTISDFVAGTAKTTYYNASKVAQVSNYGYTHNIFLGAEWKSVASGLTLDAGDYTYVDYIQSSGTQWIDTGFADPNGIRAVYKAEFLSSGYIVGSHNLASPYGRNGAYVHSDGKWEFAYGETCPHVGTGALNTLYEVDFKTTKTDAYLKVKGGAYPSWTTISTGSGQTISSYNNFLFFNQYSQNINSPATSAKVYYVQIYNSDGALVRDFVPAIRKSDSAVGMHDRVEDKFYANAGSSTFTYALKQVSYDSTYGELPTPAKKGYTFAGWYTAASGGTKVESSTKVTNAGNHTLYARWTTNSYTLTVNPNGGKMGQNIINGYLSNGTASSQVVANTMNYYIDGAGRIVSVGNGISATDSCGMTHITADIQLNVTYTRKMWYSKTVSGQNVGYGWFLNGGYNTYNNTSQWWFIDPVDNAVVSTHNFNSNSFKAGVYTLRVDPNTSANTLTVNSTVLYSAYNSSTHTKSLPYMSYYCLDVPTRTGYTFAGWQVTSGNGTVHLTDASAMTYIYQQTGAENVTITAEWTANTYEVVYNANGGSGTMANSQHTYDTTSNLTANKFTRTGYTFTGWNTKADGTGTSYADKASVKNLVASGSITLYAQWGDPINYTITYDLKGGTLSDSNPTSYNVTTASFTLKNPTKTGYTFAGWTGSNGTTPQTTVTIAKGSTGNKTYTANWTVNTYTVTYNANGGTVSPTSATVTYDSTYGTLPTATRTGYTFNGWYTTASGGTKVENSTKVTTASNHTLYAHWTANTYTVTYDANGGTVSPTSATVTFDSTYGTLPTPTRTGYSFSGWYTATSGGTKVENSTKVTTASNHTLYARWSSNAVTVTYDTNGGTVSPTSASVNYGSTYGTLPTPTRTGYAFNGWSLLPAGYTQVEYIQSSGSQYINTGYKLQNTDQLIVDMLVGQNGGNYVEFGFCGDGDAENSMYSIVGTFVYGDANGHAVGNNRSSVSLNARHIIVVNGNNYIVDGNKYVMGKTFTNAKNLDLYLFAYNKNGRVACHSPSTRIYGVQIKNSSGTYVRNLIPVRNPSGALGLYDLVENKFYANAGSGNFTAGSNVSSSITSSTVVSVPNNHTIHAHWTANTYIVGYNANGGVMSLPKDEQKTTDYIIDWSKDFSIETIFNYSGEGRRYFIFGNYPGSNHLNIEILERKLRVYINGANVDTSSSINTIKNFSSTVPTNTDISVKFTWTAGAKAWSLTATARNWSDSANGTSTVTGKSEYGMAVGRDYRGTGAFGEIKVAPLTIKTGAAAAVVYPYALTETYDSTYGTLPTAERLGYTFAGWYTAASGGTKVESSTMVTTASNHTLYARWTTNSYTLTVNPNGGKMGQNIINGYFGQGSSSNQISAGRISFYNDEAGRVIAKGIDSTNSDNYGYVGLTVDLTAGVTYTRKMYHKSSISGTSVDLGWFLNPDRTYWYHGGAGASGSAPTFSIAAGKNGNYILRLDPNKYTNIMTLDSIVVYQNLNSSTYTKSLPYMSYYCLDVPTRTGYTFAGWQVTSGNGTVHLTDASAMTYIYQQTGAENVTITAQWTANTYEVVYNANGGSGTMANSQHIYDTTSTLSANTFIRTGYTFAGWNTKADGTGTSYANKASVKNLVASGSITLYAQWGDPINYTITYDLKGGALSDSNPTSYNVTTASFTLKNPTKTGYTFAGWTGSNGTTPQTTVTIAKGSTENKTYTANWTANTYTVTYNGNGHTGGATVNSTHTYDSPKALASNGFTKTGYTFAGWSTSASGSVVYTNGQSVNNLTSTNGGTVSLYAKWTANSYNLTLNHGDYTMLEYIESSGTQYIDTGVLIDSSVSAEFKFAYNALTNDETYVFGADIYPYPLVGAISGQFRLGIGDGKFTSFSLDTNVHVVNYSSTEIKFDGISKASGKGTYVKPYNYYLFAGNDDYGVNYFTSSKVYYLKMYKDGILIRDMIPVIKDSSIGMYDLVENKFYANAGTGTFKAGYYKSTFDSNYGELQTPSKNGYSFDGWYTTANGGTKVEATTKVSTAGDHTLYAHWTANGYSVAIDYAEGENLIKNPSFENGGWHANGSTIAFSNEYVRSGNYSMKLKGSSGSPEITVSTSTTCELKTNHIYYVSVYGYQVTRSGTTVQCYWPIEELSFGSVTIGAANQWNLYSFRSVRSKSNTGTTWSGNYPLRFDFDNDYSTGDMYFDDCKLIDLTAMFGAGNEPDKAWCDINLAGMQVVTPRYDVEMPSITPPTRTGYRFNGVFDQPNGAGTQYYLASGASARAWDKAENTTLYADWLENTYSLEFDGNGATKVTMDPQTGFVYNAAKVINVNTYELPGYTFLGWKSNVSGGYYGTSSSNVTTPIVANETIIPDGAYVVNLTTEHQGKVKLTAQWQADIFTTTFTAGTGTITSNGAYSGSGTLAIKDFEFAKAYTSQIAPSSSNITKTGYTFGGYYLATDFRNNYTSYLTQSEHCLLRLNAGTYDSNHFKEGMIIGLDVTITGAKIKHIEINDRKIDVSTLRYQIINDSRVVAYLTYTSSDVYSNYSFIDIVCQKSGNYSFTINEFWTSTLATQLTDTDGKLKAGASNYTNDKKQWMHADNVFVAPKWTPITYTIAYNANGGSGTTASSTHTYDASKALTAEGFTRAYSVIFDANGGQVSPASATATYTFAGWNTKADGTGTAYANNQRVVNLTTKNETITLYAQWTSESVILPTPTREGHTFKGWYTDKEGGVKVEPPYYTPTQAITLYARWQINTFTVTIKDGGQGYGTVSQTTVANVPYGTKLTVNGNKLTVNGTVVTATPNDRTAQYTYSFLGWVNGTVEVKSAVTVTASFGREENYYDITWKNHDGSVIKVDSVKYGDKPAYTGLNPTKPSTAQYDFEFKGWDKTIVAVTGPETYTAEFNSILRSYTITWKNYDGTELGKNTVFYGSTPSYTKDDQGVTRATPTKPSTAQYHYEFKGWTPAVASVTGTATYTAEFNAIWRTYDVTIQTDGQDYGSVSSSSGNLTITVYYGSTISTTVSAETGTLTVSDGHGNTTTTFTATPATNADGYEYEFRNWNDKVSKVEGNVTITADFVRYAIISFKTTGNDGNTYGIGVYDSNDDIIGSLHTATFRLETEKTYTLKLNANIKVVEENGSVKKSQVLRIFKNGVLESIQDTQNGYREANRLINEKTLRSFDSLSEPFSIKLEYFWAHFIDVVVEENTISGVTFIDVNEGNNYVKNYENEGALVGDKSTANFIVDSTRNGKSGQNQTEMRLFIGFKYVLGGEEFTAGVNGGKDLTYLSFTPNPNASDPTIEGQYSYNLSADKHITIIEIQTIASTPVEINTEELAKALGSITLSSQYGLNKVIDKSTTSLALHIGTWTITLTNQSDANLLEKIFKNAVITNDGNIITLHVS